MTMLSFGSEHRMILVDLATLKAKTSREITQFFLEKRGCVLWALRSGAHWQDLPERYGKWKTMHKRFTRWAKAGV
jgi:hypothetical protein